MASSELKSHTVTAPGKFRIIKETISGHLVVTENSQYNNIEADTVIVEPGVKARLYGNIYKHLLIRKNAKVFLHGRLYGRLEDEGGRFYYFDE